jgi:hypothetical protein
MKTAMQELIFHIAYMERRKYQDEQTTILGGMNDCIMNDAIVIQSKVIEELTKEYAEYLEKEKEQIVDACNANLKGLLTNGKDYYDLNFNHHIESEPNTYTNFTPHNANAVAEHNEGLKNFTPNK